jgi:hypothetical protein
MNLASNLTIVINFNHRNMEHFQYTNDEELNYSKKIYIEVL